jgi:hypothetical protein
VPEQVDGNDGPAGISEEIDPSRGAPTVLERRAESVDQNDGLGAHADTVRGVRDAHAESGKRSAIRALGVEATPRQR